MNIKQKVNRLITGSLLVFSLVSITAIASVSPVSAAECGGVQTSIINCSQDNKSDSNGNGRVDAQETGVWGILVIVLNVLIAGVAVLALAGVVYGAVLYTSAGGNAEQVKKAYGIFTNVVIGVIAFAGMWVLLNFLIPGGAFNYL